MSELSPELRAELHRLPPDVSGALFAALASHAGRLQPGSAGVLTQAWGSELPPGADQEVVGRFVAQRLADPRWSGFLTDEARAATHPAQQGGRGSSQGVPQQGSLDQIASAWRAQHETYGLRPLQDAGAAEQAQREAIERTRGAIGHFQPAAGRPLGELVAARQTGQQAQQQNPLMRGFGLTGVSRRRPQQRPMKG